MNEVWKSVTGFELYEVSNNGRIRSWNGSKRNKYKKLENPKILKPISQNGYYKVTLYDKNKRKDKRLHRLIAFEFIPNPENKKCINHKDGNKLNNHVHNLEWVTHKENMQHSYKNGFHKAVNGENHACAKLTENDVLDIRNAYRLKCFTQKEIAEAYNVHVMTISDIIRRKNWQHI